MAFESKLGESCFDVNKLGPSTLSSTSDRHKDTFGNSIHSCHSHHTELF